jgi:hypothetical protein
MRHGDAGRALEHFGEQMVGRAGPARSERQLAGIGLGVCDQFRHGFHRQRRIDDQHERALRHERERNEIGHRIVGQVLVQCDVDRHRRRCRHQERVAVGRGFRVRVRADRGTGTRLVLDHERFAEARLELLADEARQDLGGAARGERHDDGDRPRRVILRTRASVRMRELYEGKTGKEQSQRTMKCHGAPFGPARNRLVRYSV